MATINSGVAITTPSAPVIAAGSASGSLGAGNYSYKVTYVTAFGESLPSAASNVVNASASSSMAVSSIPTFANKNVTSRKLYRTAAGGASYLLLATISDNTTTTYTDTTADGSLGAAAPTFSTADSLQVINGWCSFAKPIQASVTTGITAAAGGGQANAVALTSQFNVLSTVGTAADSVLLPALNANFVGARVIVKNGGANSANVFPFTGQTINALAANTALAVAAAATTTFVAVSATNWQSY
jgi:hypothetical protein